MTAIPETGAALDDRPSLSEQVYRRLRLDLMSGTFQPGEKLNISRLAERFGTSVTPVREAIFQLIREQALELRLGHQPRVPVLEIGQYVNLRETRAPLERLATELATPRIGDGDLEELAELHRRFVEREEADDWSAALAANREFHFLVFRASDNAVLVRVIENLWLIAGPFSTNQYPAVRNARADPHPHNLLMDALRRRAPAEAGDAMVKDLRDGSFRVLQEMQSRIARESRFRPANLSA